MEEIIDGLSRSLVCAVTGAAGMAEGSLRLRIPARGADAACPLIGVTDLDAVAARLSASAFTPVLGVLPVSGTEHRHGWLLFTLSGDFYTAAIRHVQKALPLPASDEGSYALNRMLCYARAGGSDCPTDERVRRAMLLALCCYQSRAALDRAEQALLCMTHHVPVRERAALRAACGGAADAAARMLAAAYGV